MPQILSDRLGRRFNARSLGLVGTGIHRRSSSTPHTKTGGGQRLKRPLSVASLHPLPRKECPLLSQMTSNLPVSTHSRLTKLHEDFRGFFLAHYSITPDSVYSNGRPFTPVAAAVTTSPISPTVDPMVL